MMTPQPSETYYKMEVGEQLRKTFGLRIHIHRRAHVSAHTHTHAHFHGCTFTCTRVYTQKHSHACMCLHMHAHSHTGMHIHTHAHVSAHTHRYTRRTGEADQRNACMRPLLEQTVGLQAHCSPDGFPAAKDTDAEATV